MTNLQIECMAEIININVSMKGIIKKVAIGKITEVQGVIELGKEIKRQTEYLKMFEKNGQ